jgi:phosphatidylethanolamine/phosphatidyl-N-methylethanolamine N-methyltransferase
MKSTNVLESKMSPSDSSYQEVAALNGNINLATPTVSEKPVVTLSDVTTSYRRWAHVYDRVFGAVLEDGRRKLIDEVRALKPETLLEMGVGTGLLLKQYPREAKVTGVDISREMLAHAHEKVGKYRLDNVTLQEEDCEHLTFVDQTFDCVVLPYVLSVTPNPDALVREAIRVCKSTGHIVLVNHFSGSKTWAALESIAAPVAKKIGFRSSFSYEDHVLRHAWCILRAEKANLLGLSKVVLLKPKNIGAQTEVVQQIEAAI